MLPTDLMKNDQLLAQISEYCRQAGMAESTFGRRAVNDGKLVARLREGKRITTDTLDRIRVFLGDGLPGEGATPTPPIRSPPLESSWGRACGAAARGKSQRRRWSGAIRAAISAS